MRWEFWHLSNFDLKNPLEKRLKFLKEDVVFFFFSLKLHLPQEFFTYPQEFLSFSRIPFNVQKLT